MYVLISGYLPFFGKGQPEVYKAVRTGNVTFEHQEFSNVHASAKGCRCEEILHNRRSGTVAS